MRRASNDLGDVLVPRYKTHTHTRSTKKKKMMMKRRREREKEKERRKKNISAGEHQTKKEGQAHPTKL